jgi:hypothetical protein
MGTLGLASAEPVNNSGLSASECYQKDSGCTRFCGQVKPDMRYECFSICDRMLDHCLDTGEWSDSKIDPGTGRPLSQAGQLAGSFLEMIMILGDSDGDGLLSEKEIEAAKQRVCKVGANVCPAPRKK